MKKIFSIVCVALAFVLVIVLSLVGPKLQRNGASRGTAPDVVDVVKQVYEAPPVSAIVSDLRLSDAQADNPAIAGLFNIDVRPNQKPQTPKILGD